MRAATISFFRRAPGAATIRGVASIRINTVHNKCNHFPKLHENSCDYMLISYPLVSKANHKNVAVQVNVGKWSTSSVVASRLEKLAEVLTVPHI